MLLVSGRCFKRPQRWELEVCNRGFNISLETMFQTMIEHRPTLERRSSRLQDSSKTSKKSNNTGKAYLNLCIAGQDARHYEITERITTIGRSKDNVLEIADKNMSRRHTVIERRDDDTYIVTDCNSSNGTLVNEERMISTQLFDNDWIECGQTRIQFINQGSPPRSSAKTVDSEVLSSEFNEKTAELGVLLGQREDLRKLLAINKELNREHELRPLLERIIDTAIELMAAERGYLILADHGEMKVEIARGLSKDASKREGPAVSKQICNEVMDHGKAILTTNAVQDETYGRFQSVVGLGIHSVLCVPFKIKETVLGVIYLDNDRVGAFSEMDVELLEAFSDQAAVAIDNARLIRVMKQKERLEQEMHTAAEIQAKLLPRKLPELTGLQIAGKMEPAKDVGGDYYDFVPLNDGTLLICIGDVSGKGVPAGLIMASARSMIRSLAPRIPSTKDLIGAINELLSDDLDMDMFMSLLVLRYDPERGSFTYTGAGHEHLIIFRHNKNACEYVKAGGVVLGVTNDIDKYLSENVLQIDKGDMIILYTDGVTEAFNKEREQYQLESLVESSERHAHKSAQECLNGIFDDVMVFAAKAPQSDDITLVTLKRV
jgi:serine phosphatase RsbU (regulator of sigma subunit)/pSer/pThr/pTyr-binding forkhead associated (FHA) protein